MDLERLPYRNNTCIHWISNTLVNTGVVPIRRSCHGLYLNCALNAWIRFTRCALYHKPAAAIALKKWDSGLSLSLSLIPCRGDGSPPQSSPGSSIGVLGRFDSGDLAMTPAAPGRVLGSVTPDVLPSRQHHCNVDKWLSLDIRCGAGRPPTMENGPCTVVWPVHSCTVDSGLTPKGYREGACSVPFIWVWVLSPGNFWNGGCAPTTGRGIGSGPAHSHL